MNKKDNLKHLLNLNFLDFTNKTFGVGKYNLPYVPCKLHCTPDYIALYSEIKNYKKTPLTAVSFYQNDILFDGRNGLFNAIYYNDNKRKEYYKNRFKGVKFIIEPDYSLLGDIPEIENIYRIFKARVVNIWLSLECKIITIPNLTYASERSFNYMLDGLEDCQGIAISTKGIMKSKDNKELMKKAIKYTVNRLPLKTIIVYSDCKSDNETMDLLHYARLYGIKIVIPNNLLKERNTKKIGIIY